MAASRTPQQPKGNHRCACAELAASLRSRAFVSSRPASTAASQATQTAEPRSRSHAEVGQRPPSTKASPRKTRLSRKRHSSPGLEFRAPERLTAAIRACASTADLIALHRKHGAAFNHIHACAALHRLADVAALTGDSDDSPTAPQPSHEPHPRQSSAPSDQPDGAQLTNGPQLTGRLRVRQGQQVSETAAYVGSHPASAVALTGFPNPQQRSAQLQAAQVERMRSNSEASTSAPSSASHAHSAASSSRLGRLHSHPNALPHQGPHDTSGRIQGSSGSATTANGSVSNHHTALESPLASHEDRLIADLGARLAAILQRSCPTMDGRGVATAASALSRLRYAHAELLRQLERRSLELLRAQLKTVATKATGASKGRVAKCTSEAVKADLGRISNEGGAATAEAAVTKLTKVKKRLTSSDGGGGVGDADSSSATQLVAADTATPGNTRARSVGEVQLRVTGSALERTDLGVSVVTSSAAVRPDGPQDELGAAVNGSVEHEGPASHGHPHAAGQQTQELRQGLKQQQQQRKDRDEDAQHQQVTQGRQGHCGTSAEESGGTDHHRPLPTPSCEAGLDPEELYALVAAFGSLTHITSREWQAAVTAALQSHLPSYAAPRPPHIPARLPVLLCSLVNSGARPPIPWLKAVCAAARPHLPSYNARQLRSLVTGLAALQHRPDDPWVNEYLAASEAALPTCGAEDLEAVLTGLADLGCRPGEGWMAAFYERSEELVMSAGGIMGAQASSLLFALSRLSLRPSREWLNTLLLATRRGLFDISAAQLTQHLSALCALRFRPPEPWLQHYYTASFQRLPFHTPQQAVDAATALAALGVTPQHTWLQELGRQLGGKLGLLPGGQQAAALGALVALGYKPGATWLAGYEKASNGRLAACSVTELCRALAALAKLGFKPHASWLYSFIMAAYSKLDAFDAAQLALVFESLPALTPHGSWLDEIIQICAAESAMRSQSAAAREAASASSSSTSTSLISAAAGGASSSASSEDQHANSAMAYSSSTTSATAGGATTSASAAVGVTTTTTVTTTAIAASGPAGDQHQDVTSRGSRGSRVVSVSGGPAAVLAASARGAAKRRAASGSLPERLKWASMKVRKREVQRQQLQRQRQLVGRQTQQMAAGKLRTGAEAEALQQMAQRTTLPASAVEAPVAEAAETAPRAAPLPGSAVEGALEGGSRVATQQGRGYSAVTSMAATSGSVATSGGLFTSGAVTLGKINDYHPEVVDAVDRDGDDVTGSAAAAAGDVIPADYGSSAGDAEALGLTSAAALGTQPAVRVLSSLESETQPLARKVATMAQLDVGRVRVVVDGPVTITTEPISVERGLVSMEPPPYIGLSRGPLAAGGGNGNGDSTLLSVIGNRTEDGGALQLSVVSSSFATASMGALSAAAARTAAANASGVMQPTGRMRRNGAIDDRNREGGLPGASGSKDRDRDSGGDTGDESNGGGEGGGGGGNGKSSRDAGPSEQPPVILLRGPIQDTSDREGPGMVLLKPPTARAPAAVGLALASLSSLQSYDPTLIDPTWGNGAFGAPRVPSDPPSPLIPETSGAPPVLLPKPLAGAGPSTNTSTSIASGGAARDALSNDIMLLNAAAPKTGVQTPSAPAASASNPVPPFHGTALTLPTLQQPLQSAMATTPTNGTAPFDRAVQYLDSASLNRLIGAPDDPPGPDFSSCRHSKPEKATGRTRARRGSTRMSWATGALPSPSA